MKKSLFGLGGLAGLVLGVAGCGAFNQPPKVSMYELDGTLVNPTVNNQIVESDACDVEVMLPMNRGDLIDNEERFRVEVIDSDGPEHLSVDIYPSTVADNPISIETYGRSDSITENGSIVRTNINIVPTENTHLGTYRMFVVKASDGKNTTNYCVYGIVAPSSSTGNGQLPQTDDNPTLEDVVDFGCDLPGSAENDLILYRVTHANGAFSSDVVAELDRNAPGGDLHHYILPSNTEGSWYVVKEGRKTDGIYAEVVGVDNAKLVSDEAYVPDNCDSIAVLNPNRENLSGQRYVIYSYPEN